MSWLQLSIDVSREDAPLVEQAFTSTRAHSVSFSDAGAESVLEPAPGAVPLWPRVRITGLYPEDTDPDGLRLRLLALLGDAVLDARIAMLPEQDWVAAWLARAKPMRFGQSLWVVPGKAAAPQSEDAAVVRLDPGLAFGTGSHPTTGLCLEWLDAHPPVDRRVIDYGCGSGILAVAAARLGAKVVYCVDHDPQAHSATIANAETNGVADKLTMVEPEQLRPGEADLVLANILLKPLTGLAPLFASILRPGGALVLSGVLETQRAELERAYRPWFGDVGRAGFELRESGTDIRNRACC